MYIMETESNLFLISLDSHMLEWWCGLLLSKEEQTTAHQVVKKEQADIFAPLQQCRRRMQPMPMSIATNAGAAIAVDADGASATTTKHTNSNRYWH
jgi:hypothetical protein